MSDLTDKLKIVGSRISYGMATREDSEVIDRAIDYIAELETSEQNLMRMYESAEDTIVRVKMALAEDHEHE